MEYAFEHEGIGYTPSGKLTLAAKRIPSYNAECEARELADFAAGKPIVVYPSHDSAAPSVTLWTGVPLGHVLHARTFRNPFGGTLTAYTWRDNLGRLWHGRGVGDGMALISRRSK